MSDAYKRGYAAGLNNESYPDSGPYAEGTLEYKQFWGGYRDAMEDQ